MVQNTLLSGCTVNIPSRFMVAIMIFVACLFSYMLRVNMSINLIAMVQPTVNTVSGKVNIPECSLTNNQTINTNMNRTIPNYGARYNWDQQTQGLILGAYFWGYIFTQIPGGLLAEKWGARHLIGWVGIASAVLTMLTPLSASVHYGVVVGVRFLLGLANGLIYPSLHCLISRWAPPDERGKFTGALLGGNFGTVITWPFLAAVSESLGWMYSFYIPGALVLVFIVTWYRWVYDSPEVHPRIPETEVKYIQGKINSNVGKRKHLPPYGKILRSPPFISLLLLHYGNCWGLSLLLTTGPKYLAEVLGFKLSGAGGLAALPYLARIIMAFVFGAIGDVIRRTNWMTVTSVRKWFVIFSHFLPGILLFIQPSTGCNVTMAILLITLSLGLNGACTITNIQNAQDLAPNFAGTLYGIINCVASTTGFITPMLAGYITQNKNGLEEWRLVFTIGAIVYIATGIVFCIFGSGEIQPWNEIKSVDEPTNQGCDNNGYDQSEDSIEKTNGKIDNHIVESTKV